MADPIIIFKSANNSLMRLLCLIILVGAVNAVILKKECPIDETHRSCWFYEEYTCWEDERRLNRVMILPKRLTHCISGCYCKKGYVREYPTGPCSPAPHCLNVRVKHFLNKLPV